MDIATLGVPSAAGAYGAGVGRAPGALRDAGLISALRRAGLTVTDQGDLPGMTFAPDPVHKTQQNLDRVVEVARAVADRIAETQERSVLPLILGGDCTITLGVLAGVMRQRPDVALAYLDGDADLSTPLTTRSGILDAMGVAHMLGIEGAAEPLVGIGDRIPLLLGHRLALIGYDESEVDDLGRQLLEDRGVHRFPQESIRGRAGPAAADALAALGDRDGLIVHFDVDVIDSTDLPLGQYPHFNAGLSLHDAMEALTSLCSAPDIVAIVVTEVDPDNDPERRYVPRLVDALANALGAGLAGGHHDPRSV